MVPQTQPEQQAPPAMWLRMRYSKHGPARFTSTRDFGRAFERALRRAQIPMAYSSGFHSHPRISYANGAPTGAATSAEYVAIGLREVCDPHKVMAALNDVLPPGMAIEQVAVGKEGFESLEAAQYLIRIDDVDADVACPAVDALLAAETVEVSRMTKSGLRTFDVRAAVLSLEVVGEEPTTLRSVTRQGSPLVRPEDVVSALTVIHPAFAPANPVLLERETQGRLVDGKITDPLA